MPLSKNVGSFDRTVRLVLCAILLGAGFFAPIGKVAKIAVFAIAAGTFFVAMFQF